MEDRKNWQALVTGFWTEFSKASDNQILLLRTYLHSGLGLDESNFDKEKIRLEIKQVLISNELFSNSTEDHNRLDRIIVISEHLSSTNMIQFYKQCDGKSLYIL